MKTKRVILVILSLLFVFALCSCGAGSQAEPTSGVSVRNSGGGWYSDKATSAESYYEKPDGTPEIQPSDGEEFSRKIIKRQYLTVETLAFDEALAKITGFVSDMGGYFAATDISNNSIRGYYSNVRRATLSVRIPEDKLEAFVAKISSSDTFNILRNSLSTEEVTDTYYDLKAQLDALMAQEARLTELMNEAKNLSDMLTIENKLTSVRREINSVSSRIQYYDKAVAMSFVEITLDEVEKYEPTKEKTFFDKVGEAFVGAWEVFGEFLSGAVIVFLWILPFVLTLGVIAAIVIVVVLKNKKKKAKAKEQKTEETKQ